MLWTKMTASGTMPEQNQIDCVLIGYNDSDFEAFAAKQMLTRDHWGAYHEVQTNSVIFGGRRITFLDLMNRAIESATGKDPRFNVFEAPSLAACYLASYLRTRKFRAEVVNLFNREKDKLRNLLARSPLAVAITTTFYVEPEPIREIIRFVREHNRDVKIIVGGPHIYNTTADHAHDPEGLELVLQSIGADIYIHDSQGEKALGEVIGELRKGPAADFAKIANLSFTRDGIAFQRTRREVESNALDENAVDWSLFETELVAPLAYMRTARSCPFACSFCQYPVLAGPHETNDIASVGRQLRQLYEAGTKDIVFVDDTFNVPLPRFKKILQMMIDHEFNFRWTSFLRCSNVDAEAIELMARSGCLGSFLGIESGDQTILDHMNKKVKIERYKWGIGELKKYGIATLASIICGFPGETEQSILNTMEFIEETAPSFYSVQLYYHDASAPIHRKAPELGIQGSGYSWSHNTMHWQQGIEWAKYMFKNIHNSVYISTYGFSLWGISYLASKGITVEQVQAFGKATKDMLLDSLADRPADAEPERVRHVAKVFQPSEGRRVGDLLRMIDAPFWEAKASESPQPVPLCASVPGERQGIASAELTLDATVSQGLLTQAFKSKTTISNLTLALFDLFLFQLTKKEQIYVGVQTVKNTVPIWVRMSNDMEFDELMDEVIRSADGALDHQDYDFAHLPKPNVLFAYENIYSDGKVPAHDFDLRLVLSRWREGIQLKLEYETSLFSAEQVQSFLHTFRDFSRMIASPLAA